MAIHTHDDSSTCGLSAHKSENSEEAGFFLEIIRMVLSLDRSTWLVCELLREHIDQRSEFYNMSIGRHLMQYQDLYA